MERATLVMNQPEERVRKPHVRYEDDVHAWAFEQAELLKGGHYAELDIVNLVDEIEDVAHREFDKLESNLAIVIQHLIKWERQPQRRCRSWVLSIQEHRRRINKQLKDFGSLARRTPDALSEAYRRGRAEALIETELPSEQVPEENRYSWEDVMTRLIDWPER